MHGAPHIGNWGYKSNNWVLSLGYTWYGFGSQKDLAHDLSLHWALYSVTDLDNINKILDLKPCTETDSSL